MGTKTMMPGVSIGIDWGADDRATVCWWQNGALIDKADIPRLRLINDQIMVALDPDPVDKTSKGGIYIPQTSTDDILRRGTVVKTGPGKWADKPYQRGDGVTPVNKKATDFLVQFDDEDGRHLHCYQREPLGVEAGERVLFIKFAVSHTETAKRVQALIGHNFGLINPSDILLVGPDVDKVTG